MAEGSGYRLSWYVEVVGDGSPCVPGHVDGQVREGRMVYQLLLAVDDDMLTGAYLLEGTVDGRGVGMGILEHLGHAQEFLGASVAVYDFLCLGFHPDIV